jgi:hypothetical protein
MTPSTQLFHEAKRWEGGTGAASSVRRPEVAKFRTCGTKMGCWGSSSYDNDGTMDELILQDKYYVDPDDHSELSAEGKAFAFNDIHPSGWEDPGVAVWLVENGAYVPEEHIRTALMCLRSFLHPQADMDLWGRAPLDEEGLAVLKSEIKLLERALQPAAPNVVQPAAPNVVPEVIDLT